MNYTHTVFGNEYGLFHSMSVSNTGWVLFFNCKIVISTIYLWILSMLLIMYVVLVV